MSGERRTKGRTYRNYCIDLTSSRTIEPSWERIGTLRHISRRLEQKLTKLMSSLPSTSHLRISSSQEPVWAPVVSWTQVDKMTEWLQWTLRTAGSNLLPVLNLGLALVR
jgi:hypothetical protein